jgi:conjugal transfer/entry exclusion protein
MEKKTIKLSKSDWLRVGQKLGYLSKSAQYFSYELVVSNICSELKQLVDNHPHDSPTHLTAEHAKRFQAAADEIKEILKASAKASPEPSGNDSWGASV